MSDVMGIAVSGMNDAVLRVQNAAKNIANVSSQTADGEKYTPTDVVSVSNDVDQVQMGVTSEVVSREPASEVDLAQEVVQMVVATVSYSANAEVVKTANDMQRRMLDTLA